MINTVMSVSEKSQRTIVQLYNQDSFFKWT